jgi:hypothetical protein
MAHTFTYYLILRLNGEDRAERSGRSLHPSHEPAEGFQGHGCNASGICIARMWTNAQHLHVGLGRLLDEESMSRVTRSQSGAALLAGDGGDAGGSISLERIGSNSPIFISVSLHDAYGRNSGRMDAIRGTIASD